MLLDCEFYRDINWFCSFLESFNGVVAIHEVKVFSKSVHVDACLQGCGAFYQGEVYHCSFPTVFRLMLSIVHLEMLNALLAVKMWAQDWADTSVCMYCDNRAVVDVISGGRSKDEYLGACARNI